MPIKDKTVLALAKMGYTMDEASIAMERCGVYLIVRVHMYLHVCSYDAVACCFLKWFSYTFGLDIVYPENVHCYGYICHMYLSMYVLIC